MAELLVGTPLPVDGSMSGRKDILGLSKAGSLEEISKTNSKPPLFLPCGSLWETDAGRLKENRKKLGLREYVRGIFKKLNPLTPNKLLNLPGIKDWFKLWGTV